MNSPCKDSDRRVLLVAVFIVTLTIAAYWQLKDNGFVNFDDPGYITENPFLRRGMTAETIKWAFSFPDKITYWHPLTWFSLMLDYELFGLNPAGYHLVNLLFHVTNAVLLFLILNRMTQRLWPSAFVAAVFALHPLNVESVAWVVERKTLLSALFFMLTIRAYLYYAERPGFGRYSLVLLFMALGLMAKSMLVTLPFVLLLLDYWPLGRMQQAAPPSRQPLSFSRLLLEKVPLMALSVSSVAVSVLSLRYSGGIEATAAAPFGNRMANALVSYIEYVRKMCWPSGLAPYYPLQPSYPPWQVAGAAFLLAGASFFVIRGAKRRPWLLVGWLWYLGVLLPVIGLVRGGLWPAMADRFAYLPLIGLFIIIAWGMAEGAAQRRLNKVLLCCGAAAIIAALTVCTFIRTGVWKNSITLFEHALKVTGANATAYSQLGIAYLQEGDYDRALAYFKRERELKPDSVYYEVALGNLYYQRGELQVAVDALKQALLKKEESVDALLLLGKTYERSGEHEKAVESYTKAMVSRGPDSSGFRESARQSRKKLLEALAPELDAMRRRVTDNPRDMGARGALALKLDALGFYDEALDHYLKLEKAGAGSWQLFFNTGNVHKKRREYREAARYYEKSLALHPGYPDTLNNLGIVCREMKEFDRAISAFERAIAGNGQFDLAPFNLALTYLQMGDKRNALRYFRYTQERFPRLQGGVAPYMRNLQESAAD